MNNKKSSISGIDANIIVLTSYLGALIFSLFSDIKFIAWLLPLVIYIIERSSEFVKKHAAQSTLLFATYSVISMIIAALSLIAFENTDIHNFDLTNFAGSLLLVSIINIISITALVIVIVFAIICTSKTYHYEDYDIPVIKNYLPKFRKFMDNLMNNNKTSKQDSDIIIEEESEIIMDVEIEDKFANENELLKKKTKKEKDNKNIKKKESDNNE